MFTINTQWALGKSGVRWESSENAPQKQQPIDPVAKAKVLLQKMNTSTFSKASEIRELHDIVEGIENTEITKRNTIINLVKKELDKPTRTQEVYDKDGSDAYYALPTEGDKRDYRAMLTKWSNEYSGIEANFVGKKNLTKDGIVGKISDAKKLNTPVVGQAEQAIAIGQILGVDAKNSLVIEKLKDTNIPSLLAMVTTQPVGKLQSYVIDWTNSDRKTDIYDGIRDLGYSSNGALGNTELSAVKNFIEYYLKSDTDTAKIKQVATYTQAGLSTTVLQKDLDSKEKIQGIDTIITYLADLPNARFKTDDINKALTARKTKKDFIQMINRVTGGYASDVQTLIAGLKSKPELKARFYENINTAGANQTIGLGAFLDGKGADLDGKGAEKADVITKTLKEKVEAAVTVLKAQSSTTTNPEEKAKIDTILAEYNKKGDSWMTGEIRKVAEGAFVNIGKNANTVGAGMAFETFIKGLTVNLGAGISNGKVGPAIVVHYDIASGQIGETEKKIIEGSIGVGTSIFPAVIPFISGSIKGIDKITVYGDGAGRIRSVGLNAMIASGGGSLSLAFLEERKSEIDQGVKLMNSVIDKFSVLSDAVNAQQITDIITSQKGMKITPTEADYWVGRIKELFRVNGVTAATSPEAKAILIKGLVESEGEKKHTQEAMNDLDGRSYKGFSVGVGHLFGVTFPLVGVYFKEGKIQYNYKDAPPDQQKEINSIAKQAIDTPAVEASSKKEIENQKELKAIDTLVSRQEILDSLGGSIYRMSRDKKTYPLFDNALVKIGNGDYVAARKDLEKMKKSKVAQSLVAFSKDDPSKLAIVNTFTYGTRGEKNKNTLTNKDYASARADTLKAENRLSPENPAAEKFFKEQTTHSPISIMDKYDGQDIASSVFATPAGGSHRIDKYPGSVKVSDSIYTGNMLESQKKRLIAEHQSSIDKNLKALNDQFNLNITNDQYVNMLNTGTVPQELADKGLTFAKKPQFIEARAMVLGNICANRVEAIVFPTFTLTTSVTVLGRPATYKTVKQDVPTPSDFDPVGAGFLATEVASGLLGGAHNKPEDPVVQPANSASTTTSSGTATGPATGTITSGGTVTPPIALPTTPVVPPPVRPPVSGR